jgi:gas vesicle protein
MSDRDFSTGHFLVAFMSGAAVGAVVTLLTTPQSGPETRRQIAGAINTARDEMTRIPPALRDAYGKAAEAAKRAFAETYHQETEQKAIKPATEEA